MAHPFQQRKLLVTVCKAEVGWDQPEACALQSGHVTLVAGPFRASTRSVPVSKGGRGGGSGVLRWAPAVGGELFVLSEDCLLVSELVLGAELWGQRRGGGRWSSDALYAQAEICLDAPGQALLLSGRCLQVRLPLVAPQGQAGGKGKGGGGAAGAGPGGRRGGAAQASAPASGSGPAAPGSPVLGVLALSLLLQPAEAESAVTRQLPVELVPRLLLDTSRLLPGAVLRGAAGAAYVDPCVVFIRVRLLSASGLGRGAKDSASSHGGSTPRRSRLEGGGGGGAGGPGGLPGGGLEALGSRLHAHMDRTLGHVGALLGRLWEQRPGGGGHHHHQHRSHLHPHGKGQRGEESAAEAGGTAAAGAADAAQTTPPNEGKEDVTERVGTEAGSSGGGGKAPAVDHAAAEAVMSLLESNGFAVVDHRRLSSYFWCKVSYEGQYHTSRLVPVSGGCVVWDEGFVVAALRPIRPAPLEIELYGSNDSKSRGKVVCSLAVPLCDLVAQLEAQHAARRQAARAEAERAEAAWRQANSQATSDAAAAAAAGIGVRAARAAAAARGLFWSAVSPASAGGGASGAPPRPAQLPNFHPDTWPRGRVTLSARLGAQGGHAGTGGALAAALAAASPGGAGGGGGGGRDCSFSLEFEVVDADPRAEANGTQLLPWAPNQGPQGPQAAGPAPRPETAVNRGEGGGLEEGDGGGAGTGMARAGSLGGFAAASAASAGGAEGGGGRGEEALGSPWGPDSARGGGGGGVLSPAGSGSLSLGALVAAAAEEPNTPRAPQPPSSFEDQTTSLLARRSQPPGGPGDGGAATPTADVSQAADAAAAEPGSAAASAAAAPGLCSAATLAASAAATLSLVVHDLQLELPPPPEGVLGGGAGSGGAMAAHAAAVSSITQGDYFVAIRAGGVWATTNSLRVVGAGCGAAASAGSSAAASLAVGFPGCGGGPRLAPHLGLVAPLLRPSALVSLALFRRTDTLAGRKVLNVRAMIGMSAAEALVGKLRLRASSLLPGRPVTVCLPLKAERSGPRPCATVAWCRLTLLLSPGPGGMARLLAAYAEPPTYPPVAMLLEGAVPGRGLSATLPALDPARRADADALKRREKRVLIKWVSESSPGVSANTARKLLEDGRTEFNAGRTTENWRRVAKAVGGTEPLKRFWGRVQSWEQPALTLAVAAGELALLAWPSRVLALSLLVLVLQLLRLRTDMLHAASHAADAAAEGEGEAGSLDGEDDGLRAQAAEPAAEAAAGRPGARRAAGDRPAPGVVPRFGEPCPMVDDIGSEREPGAGAAPGTRPTDDEAGSEQGLGGGGGSGGPAYAAGGSSLGGQAASPAPSGFLAPQPAPSTSPSPSAASWLLGSSPPTSGSVASAAGGPGAGSAAGAGSGWGPGGEWSAAQRGGAAAAGGGGSGGGGGGGGGLEVPKDPLHMLRQQYDGMVYMGLRVQNVLDDIAGAMERMQALLSWRDPVATWAFLAGAALAAALLWVAGMRVLLGALLLYDLRPPRWRDPWLPPPANAFAQLPTRADLMM